MHYKHLILAFATLTSAGNITPEPQAIPPANNNNNNNNNALLTLLRQPFIGSVLGTFVGVNIVIKVNQAWANWKCRSTPEDELTKTFDDLIAADPEAGAWTATWQSPDGPYRVTFSMSKRTPASGEKDSREEAGPGEL